MSRIAKGDRVTQRHYGTGNVLGVDYRYTTIEFDDGVVRKFVTNLAQLSASSEPPPVKPPPPRHRRIHTRETESVVADHR
jgi:hypothetical protein